MNRTGLIVLVIVIVGIFLLMFALNRPAVDETRENAEAVATSTDASFDRASAQAEAGISLAALRARAEAGATYEDLSEDFAQVRARLATAYEGAEGAAAEEWADIEAGFDGLEASARAGSSSFLDSIASLIARLSADVRVESGTE